jgi:predicted methyltransferase
MGIRAYPGLSGKGRGIPILISHVQTEQLLKGREAGKQRVEISPDLSMTTVAVAIEAGGVSFPSGEMLRWGAILEINASQSNCFLIEDGKLHKILAFSELTNRVYSLMPTRHAPTMLISGIPMHRIKGTDPYRDTLQKIKTIKPAIGQVLDTATGLGYTAIEAAKTADHVVTIELDPVVLEIARFNPWSRALFDNPRISQRIGDSYDVVKEFDDQTFTRIVHDPPALALAGDLYARDFYGELYRVMRGGGKLFHYVGDPASKSGRNTTRGVIRRLQESGFSRVVRHPRAFGVVALK